MLEALIQWVRSSISAVKLVPPRTTQLSFSKGESELVCNCWLQVLHYPAKQPRAPNCRKQSVCLRAEGGGCSHLQPATGTPSPGGTNIMIILSPTETRSQKRVRFSKHLRNNALGNSRASSHRGCRSVLSCSLHSLHYAVSKRHRKPGKPMQIQSIILTYACFSPKITITSSELCFILLNILQNNPFPNIQDQDINVQNH